MINAPRSFIVHSLFASESIGRSVSPRMDPASDSSSSEEEGEGSELTELRARWSRAAGALGALVAERDAALHALAEAKGAARAEASAVAERVGASPQNSARSLLRLA